MSVLNFAEELSRLIVRYTKTMINDDKSKDAIKPLTHEEIVSTISNVLSGLRMKSTNIQKVLDNSVADSSVNTTVVSIPAISVTPTKYDKKNDPTRRFSISSEPSSNFDSSFSRLSFGDNERETETALTKSRDANKPVPRSESMIYGLKRSDTFIRQENMEVTNNDDDDDSVFMLVVPQIKTLTSHAATMLNASRQIREAVTDMESLIEGLTKQVKLQKLELTTQKQHKDNSSLNGRSSTSASKPNNLTVRRSTSTNSRTPTTSKLRTVNKEILSERRKSISNVSTVNKTGQLNKSAKVGRSMSNLSLSMCDDVPLSSSSNPVRSLRYAHVQSTIPKPSRPSVRKT